MNTTKTFSGTASDWKTHDWQHCPGCGFPCRATHKALHLCATCAPAALRDAETPTHVPQGVR